MKTKNSKQFLLIQEFMSLFYVLNVHYTSSRFVLKCIFSLRPNFFKHILENLPENSKFHGISWGVIPLVATP